MHTATHVVRTLDPRRGGPSISVPALALAAGRTRRYHIQLVDFKTNSETSDLKSTEQTKRMSIPWSPARLCLEPIWDGELSRAIQASDVVQIHGIWQQHGFAAALLARKHKKPFLVSAHGMLDPWELKVKRWKKLPYSALVERPNLRGAACLRALTRNEADDYRSFGLTAPVAIIPNGVTVPLDLNRHEFFAEHPELKGKRILLFLGRIHFKKGLDVLCRAWSEVHSRFDDAHLVIAGPDYENTRVRVEHDIEELNLQDSVTLLGMRKGPLKWNALAAAYAFVLPSYSEGFSVAVLEALGCGLPVIASRQCNFPDIQEHGCGWVIEPEKKQLEAAFIECLSATSSQYAALSAAAKKLVAERYSWDRIGKLMADTYDWVLGGNAPVDVDLRTGSGR